MGLHDLDRGGDRLPLHAHAHAHARRVRRGGWAARALVAVVVLLVGGNALMAVMQARGAGAAAEQDAEPPLLAGSASAAVSASAASAAVAAASAAGDAAPEPAVAAAAVALVVCRRGAADAALVAAAQLQGAGGAVLLLAARDLAPALASRANASHARVVALARDADGSRGSVGPSGPRGPSGPSGPSGQSGAGGGCGDAALLWAFGAADFGRVLVVDAQRAAVAAAAGVRRVLRLPAPAAARDRVGAVDAALVLVAPDARLHAALAAKLRTAASMAAVINQHFVDLAWAPVLPPAIPRAIRRPPVFAIPPALAPDAETLIARPHLRATAAFVRLSHARPWDLFTAPNPLWMRHVDIPLFTAWIAAHRRLRSSASAQSDMALAPLGLANIPADDDKLARKMAAWKNQGRVDAVCGPYVSRVASAPEPLLHASDKFSILVSTFNRIDTVVRLVKHYRQSPLVDTIFVTWHDPAREPPEPLRSIAHAVISDTDPGVDRAAIAASSNDTAAAVVLVRQTTDSLNNRFNPIGAIRTPGVLMIDDDIRIPLSQLDIGFAAWAAHQNLLVGYYPRSHEVRLPGQETPGAAPPPPYAPLGSGGPLDPQTWEFSYLYGPPHDHRRYSMMLTKGMFFHTSFLAAYTCLMPPHVHAYIDAIQNCEDIAMNFVVSGLTGLAPLTVNFPRAADSEPLEIMTDFGQHDGISGKTNHLNHRSQCLADLVRLFGTWPLVDTDIEAVRYTDAPPWVFDSLANWH